MIDLMGDVAPWLVGSAGRVRAGRHAVPLARAYMVPRRGSMLTRRPLQEVISNPDADHATQVWVGTCRRSHHRGGPPLIVANGFPATRWCCWAVWPWAYGFQMWPRPDRGVLVALAHARRYQLGVLLAGIIAVDPSPSPLGQTIAPGTAVGVAGHGPIHSAGLGASSFNLGLAVIISAATQNARGSEAPDCSTTNFPGRARELVGREARAWYPWPGSRTLLWFLPSAIGPGAVIGNTPVRRPEQTRPTWWVFRHAVPSGYGRSSGGHWE